MTHLSPRAALVTTLGLGLLLPALAPAPAAACGGCFAPSGQPSVVTAHRMAVSLGTRRTVLWDQFEYAGSPEDFVWVLPVASGENTTVELADNAFFQALQQTTQVQLTGPFRSTGGGGGGGFGCGAADAGFAAEDGPRSPPVQVFHEGTVGPYETATIGSEDAMALYDWMNERGYQVPEELLPTIEHYVDQGMSFVALRLSAGEGVNRIQPVRVSTPGMNVAFPLRMVAAGVGDFVSLELFVIAEGRYEAANFPNGVIDQSELVYDWALDEYNYDALADEVMRQDAGRTWLTEYAMPDGGTVVGFTIRDEAGEPHSAAADWSVAVESIPNPTITRMRANLPAQALREDLILAASTQGELPAQIFVENDVNWTSASVGGALTESDTRMATLPVWPFAVLGLAVFGVVRRRR